MTPSAARRLANDAEVQELFGTLRSEILEEFARTPVKDTDGMQRIRMQLDSLEALRMRIAHRAVDQLTPDD